VISRCLVPRLSEDKIFTATKSQEKKAVSGRTLNKDYNLEGRWGGSSDNVLLMAMYSTMNWLIAYKVRNEFYEDDKAKCSKIEF